MKRLALDRLLRTFDRWADRLAQLLQELLGK